MSLLSSATENEILIQGKLNYKTLKYNYINEKEEILINITTDKQNCGDSIYDLEILNQIAKKQGII